MRAEHCSKVSEFSLIFLIMNYSFNIHETLFLALESSLQLTNVTVLSFAAAADIKNFSLH